MLNIILYFLLLLFIYNDICGHSPSNDGVLGLVEDISMGRKG